MLKYDFEIDLSLNSSTGICLDKVKKGSVVLEFGCATGRMTRYMKEVLECEVYVVEWENNAYKIARQYAVDGICDDIMNFKWVRKFQNIKFDVIIFLDVLEHLIMPEKVLESASHLLKESGSIYLSIPNITHNDVLLKAYAEKFDYTSTGILDDSHIRFWGLKNLEMFAKRCNLNLDCVEATYCLTGTTEQCVDFDKNDSFLLENILRERKCGEVYQFICTLDKKEITIPTYLLKKSCIKSYIYLDTGNGFNEKEKVEVCSEYSDCGSYITHFVLEKIEKVNRIRFDPIEQQDCIIKSISISQGDRNLILHYQNAVMMKDAILLLGKDPMIYAEILWKDKAITIDAEIIITGEKYIGIVKDAYLEKCIEHGKLINKKELCEKELIATLDEKEMYKKNYLATLDEKEMYKKNYLATLDEIERHKKELADVEYKNEKYAAQLIGLNTNIEKLRQDLGAYVMLANSKDKVAIILEKELEYYKNIKIVKLHLYIIRILKYIKRTINKIIK